MGIVQASIEAPYYPKAALINRDFAHHVHNSKVRSSEKEGRLRMYLVLVERYVLSFRLSVAVLACLRAHWSSPLL